MKMDGHQSTSGCSRYEALLGDYLCGQANASDSARIGEHLQECSNCHAALEDARSGERLLRAGLPLLERSPEPRPEFARTVMARIRMERDRSAVERTGFWQPFITVAWRFAATAMVALVILLTYAVRGNNSVRRVTAGTQGPLADVFAPDPTRVPANQDEILIMVAETDQIDGND